MVRDRGFEPLTPSVSRKCSTTELTARPGRPPKSAGRNMVERNGFRQSKVSDMSWERRRLAGVFSTCQSDGSYHRRDTSISTALSFSCDQSVSVLIMRLIEVEARAQKSINVDQLDIES